MKLERKAHDMVVGITNCVVRSFHSGQPKQVTIAVRAIQERNGSWRVDKKPYIGGNTFGPWEPITSREFRTYGEAAKELRNFAKSCRTPALDGARRRRR